MICVLTKRIGRHSQKFLEGTKVMAQAAPDESQARKRGHTWFPLPAGGRSSDECLESHLRNVASIPVLPPEEERRLARRAARGDGEAQRRLVLSNLRLVVKVAARYARYGMPLCDLIQEGTLGLITAAERFDWRRGTRFSTYAVYWIREAIMRALTSAGRATSLSTHAFKRYQKLVTTMDALVAKIGREPTVPEVAMAMGTTASRVSRIFAAAAFPRSLDDPLDGEREATPVEEIACTCPCNPADLVQETPDLEQIRDAVDAILNPRERWVITHSFGLDGKTPRKLTEMARDLGVSPERVRQLRERALSKLRTYFFDRYS